MTTRRLVVVITAVVAALLVGAWTVADGDDGSGVRSGWTEVAP